MSMVPEIQSRLQIAFPVTTFLPTARAIREGIMLADDSMENISFLRSPVGSDLHGHIRRAAMHYQFLEACKRGDLPMEAEMCPMEIGSWHHLEIYSAGVRAHICRSDGPYDFPIDTPNRSEARAHQDLFAPRKQVVTLNPQVYAWLLVGVGEIGDLNHLCWGAPFKDAEAWAGHIDILRGIATMPQPTEAPSPKIDPKDKLRFRDHIEQALEQEDKADDETKDQ